MSRRCTSLAWLLPACMAGLLTAASSIPLWAAGADPPLSTRYRLLEGSNMVYWDIGGGGQMTALRGTFDLESTSNPAEFLVKQFRGFDNVANERVKGAGTYMFNWGYQRMVLDVIIDLMPHHLDSGWVPFGAAVFPMIQIELTENPPPPDYYTLKVIGAPAYGVWFSTEVPFTTGSGQVVSDGDVLTHFGRALWKNHELTANLGIQPPVPDIGCDAISPVEINGVPGWECWFSGEIDVFSELLGLLRHGDFLSQGGFIVARNKDLVQNFGPQIPGDFGLDAITVGWPCQPSWYFSTEVDFPGSAGIVHHGDVLCSLHGAIYMSNAALRANFHPVGPVAPDLGLDALYMWPTGTIWFSLEEGFLDANYGWISDGDLLSTEGWVVCRNAELLRRFIPSGAPGDLGLDALHVAPVKTGDMNGDARIDFGDINPFVLALSDPLEGYYQQFPELNPNVVGDCNYDGVMDFNDINPFVALLTGGP